MYSRGNALVPSWVAFAVVGLMEKSFAALVDYDFTSSMEGFSDAVELVPGLAIRAVAAPGHSEGSTVFFLNADLAACDLLYEAEAVDVDPSLADEERPRLVALSADVI